MSICVIIPSRTDANLNACVSAIREMGETCPVVVVNDGLTLRRPDCEYVPGQKPFIYSRAVNDGIRAAGKHTGYLILNDDALLKTPGGFAAIAWAAHNNPEYGVIGCVTNLTGQPLQRPQGIGLREVEHIAFVGVYIPRSTLAIVGGLDERYLAYGCEDRDYCLAVRKAGLKVGVFDGCYLDHASLTSTFRGHPEAPGDYSANYKLLVDKWGAKSLQ